MHDYSSTFRKRLADQVEVCARKTLEKLQKDLMGESKLTAQEVYYLTMAANMFLQMRDEYGEK